MKKIALHGIAILMALCLIISCDNSPKTKTFTVTFDSDGGTEVAAVQVEAGKKVKAPETPSKKGYIFDEWQLEETAFNFDTVIEENITLKAIWKQVFTVTFNTDGGSEIESVTVTKGETISKPADPEKSCWSFSKWTLDSNDYNFAAPVEKDIELKASWEATEAVWDGEKAVTAWFDDAVGGTTEFTIKTAAELAGLAQLVNDKTENKNTSFEGLTIKLGADLDLDKKDWTPIGNADYEYKVNSDQYHAFKGTFDGGGHTIKNLTVDSTDKNTIADGYYASGLFGWAHENSVIQNLNLENVKLDGHHNMGAVVGYLYGGQVTECHVVNATITNTHANTDGCGDKTGALVGIWQGSDDAVMKNSTAVDCTISGCRDAGQLIGAAKPARIGDGCTAENVTVTENKDPVCNDASAGNNIRANLIGREF